MGSEMDWVWLHTDRDFLINLLKGQLEAQGVFVYVKSETNSALTAGFGSSGMAQIFVKSEQKEVSNKILEEFKTHAEG